MNDIKIKKKILKKKVYEAGKKVKKEYREIEVPLYPKKSDKLKLKPESKVTPTQKPKTSGSSSGGQ